MFAKATAQNLVYRLFDITPENFRREALRLFAGGLKGLNVTLPHKQAAAELVNELTPRAERAQAVAGVMGGSTSEVSDATRDIFLEVAYFDPSRVRRTRRALQLSTDASYRYERGIDIEVAPAALARGGAGP